MGCRTYHRPSAVAGYAGDIYFPKYCTASQEEFPAIFAAFLAEEGCSNSKEKWNESLQFLEIDDTNWKKVNPHIISLITLMAAYGTCKCRSENDIKQCRKTVKEIVVQLMSGHPYFIDHPSDPTISNIELIGFLAKYWGVFITEEGMKNIETYSFKD
jgi:hypothetical protein